MSWDAMLAFEEECARNREASQRTRARSRWNRTVADALALYRLADIITPIEGDVRP